MSKKVSRGALSRAVIQQLERRTLFNAIAWDGGGDGANWSDPSNWSTNTLPGVNDDVTINVAANPTIQFSAAAGSVNIRSLNCAEVFNFTGGTLALTTGASSFSGSLSINSASLIATGAATTLTASGTTTANGCSLSATGGATISLPNLASYTEPIGFNTAFVADGANSKLQLPNLTSLVGDPGGSQALLSIQAFNGGVVTMSAVTQFTSSNRVSILADGKDASNNASLIDLSSLATFNGHAVYGSQLLISNTAEVRVSNSLTSLDLLQIQVSGAFTFKTTQITSITRSNIYAYGGAQLSFPGVTTFNESTQFGLTFQADGAGTKLALPNLTAIHGTASGSQQQLSLYATSGGTLDLSALPSITTNERVHIEANGTNSLVNLSALSSFVGHQIYGSEISDLNSGEVRVNNALTSIELTNLSVSGAFTFKSTQITGLLRSNVFVTGGAVLSFPGITSITQAIGFNQTLQAEGAGSKLSFPNLTSIAGDPSSNQNLLSIQAFNGATVEMTALTTLTNNNRVSLLADGKDASNNPSLVNLSALASFTGHAFFGSTIDVHNGGEVRVSNSLTSLDLVSINIVGAATFKSMQITSFSRGNINVASGGSISFSGLTTIAQPLNASPIFIADASILRFPNLTSITGDPGSNLGTLALQAFNGGTLDMSALPQFTSSNRVFVRADGVGSLVNLSALTSFAGHAFFGSDLHPTANGEVRVNSTGTTLSHVLLTGIGTITGTINTSTATGSNSEVGQLNITGNFSQTAAATTFADIGGPVAVTNYDRFAIGGTAALNGTLTLNLFGGYNPAYLVGHTILTAGSRTGHFSSINGLLLSPLKALAVTYTPTAVLVTAAIPGDANLDGTVNSMDFSVLATNFNQTNIGWVEGDFGGDGKTNAVDFNVLAGNYGKNTASLGAAVAEALPSATQAVSLFSSSPVESPLEDAGRLVDLLS